MLLERVRIVAGESPGRVRVEGTVRYERDGATDTIWYDLPESLEPQVSASGSPWLVALLPLAATLQETLRIAAPVDPAVLEGCHAVLETWAAWYSKYPPVGIEADIGVSGSPAGSGRTGQFFSGGVDSFYSLLRHNGEGAARRWRITDLLLVHGADIPLTDREAMDRLRPRMAEVATEFGTDLIDLATNIRETRWQLADYPLLSHGALLVAAGLLLEPRFVRLVISSSAPYTRLKPYGSHPLTDRQFSTRRTTVVHHGAECDRPEKVGVIATHPAVLRHLRVCWLGRSDTNCGRCPKCLHTMIGLELAGTLHRSATLPQRIDPAMVAQVYLDSQGTYNAYGIVRSYRQAAWLAGRHDLVRLMDEVLARSDRLRLARLVVERLSRAGLIPARLGAWWVERMFHRTVRY